MEKPGNPLLNQGIIVNTTNIEIYQQGPPTNTMNKEGNLQFHGLLAEKEKLECNHRITQTEGHTTK